MHFSVLPLFFRTNQIIIKCITNTHNTKAHCFYSHIFAWLMFAIFRIYQLYYRGQLEVSKMTTKRPLLSAVVGIFVRLNSQACGARPWAYMYGPPTLAFYRGASRLGLSFDISWRAWPIAFLTRYTAVLTR